MEESWRVRSCVDIEIDDFGAVKYRQANVQIGRTSSNIIRCTVVLGSSVRRANFPGVIIIDGVRNSSNTSTLRPLEDISVVFR